MSTPEQNPGLEAEDYVVEREGLEVHVVWWPPVSGSICRVAELNLVEWPAEKAVFDTLSEKELDQAIRAFAASAHLRLVGPAAGKSGDVLASRHRGQGSPTERPERGRGGAADDRSRRR